MGFKMKKVDLKKSFEKLKDKAEKVWDEDVKPKLEEANEKIKEDVRDFEENFQETWKDSIEPGMRHLMGSPEGRGRECSRNFYKKGIKICPLDTDSPWYNIHVDVKQMEISDMVEGGFTRHCLNEFLRGGLLPCKWCDLQSVLEGKDLEKYRFSQDSKADLYYLNNGQGDIECGEGDSSSSNSFECDASMHSSACTPPMSSWSDNSMQDERVEEGQEEGVQEDVNPNAQEIGVVGDDGEVE